ncbi:hypothetical protein HDV63DRAFT_388700 [Trichoderma sp. SZMC 28014]
MGGDPEPWIPVEDDLNPGLPYLPGAVLKIQQCRPHAPFGPKYQDRTSRTSNRDLLEQCGTPSRACLHSPPLEGEPIANPETRTIIINSQIAGGNGRGAQIVKCHYEDGETPIVAKIYDPLYYRWPDGDPPYYADLNFTTEAAAFITLQDMDKEHTIGYPRVREALKGSIPQYYGCWTCEMPLADGQRRDVRLILMEYIPFRSMYSIIMDGGVASIPAETRMQLLAKAYEIYAWLKYFGVNQKDLAPRNIMADPSSGRVVLLDFSIAEIRDLHNSRWTTRQDKPLPAGPRSPIETHRCKWEYYTSFWVPKELRSAQASFDWYQKQWGDSKVFRPLSSRYYGHQLPSLQDDIEREKAIAEKSNKSDTEEKEEKAGSEKNEEWAEAGKKKQPAKRTKRRRKKLDW